MGNGVIVIKDPYGGGGKVELCRTHAGDQGNPTCKTQITFSTSYSGSVVGDKVKFTIVLDSSKPGGLGAIDLVKVSSIQCGIDSNGHIICP
ncbi:MAG: hypothetical protein K1X82_14475 [Bacteroidia bacterium]|nr:hypothetical protein [Bacteroidia bacterium]